MPDPHFKESDLYHEKRLSGIDFCGGQARKIDEIENKDNTAAYYAMIELIDHNAGRLLKLLEETGQRENTLVIFMSDHGELIGDHGLSGNRLPFLRGPGARTFDYEPAGDIFKAVCAAMPWWNSSMWHQRYSN